MPFRSMRDGSVDTADDHVHRPLGRADRFEAFCSRTEPRLRRALVAAYGPQLGADATAAALGWAWEHFDRVEAMANPAGYLWRVGQSSTRPARRHASWSTTLAVAPASVTEEPRFEPRLITALDRLSHRQRAAVVLVHGYGYSLTEAADTLGCRVRTLRNHLDRGLTKLRHDLGVTDHG